MPDSPHAVSIIGIGKTAVAEHWKVSLRDLAAYAAQAAMHNAGISTVDAVYVGNALGSLMSNQNHVGALVADFMGQRGIEGVRIEGAEASGGLALRAAWQLIASGQAQTVMVLGVEKVTDIVGSARTAALGTALDYDYEAAMGATPAGVMALLMQRYMYQYGVTLDQFAGFSINAHRNASTNPGAMFRNQIKAESFINAPVVAPPISLFDIAPEADGAAAVILTATERAADLVPQPIRILGSGVGTDTVSLHDRDDFLAFNAIRLSAERAFAQANVSARDLDFAELHDSATIMTTLALEACGLAERGYGWEFADAARIGRNGTLPISTFGGLKARGNPYGATGIYQVVEAVQQLRDEGGENQLPRAELGMIQNVGGIGGTAVTHILARSR